MSGYVYFIEAVGADAIKIGWALAPKRRVVLLGIGCPLELRLLACAPGTRGHEGRIQTMFSEHNIRGEWHRRSARLDALISEISGTGSLPGSIEPAQPERDVSPGLRPLLRCIAVIGSQAALARVTKTTQANVSVKLVAAKRIPAHWCLTLEAETLRLGSPVWRDELRPDLYPPDDLRYLHPLRRHDLRPDLYPLDEDDSSKSGDSPSALESGAAP